jgi:hypothetical protein
MVDFTDKEKETIADVLRYRRNNLLQMVNQDKRIHPIMVEFIMLEDSILKKLNIEKS